MENQPSQLESLFEKASDYFETRLELFKLKAAEKTSDIVSELMSRMVLLAFVSIFIIMLNIGIALVLGEMMGNTYYGFFVLAGFYAIAGLVFYLFRNKWIEEPVSNVIIKKMTK
jgi:uncharacterized membrane protein YqjE